MRNINEAQMDHAVKYKLSRTQGRYLASLVDQNGLIVVAAGGSTKMTARDALNALVAQVNLDELM